MQNEHLRGLVSAHNRGLAAWEFLSISKQAARNSLRRAGGGQASVLRGSGALSAGENSDAAACTKAARVAGRQETAASCGGRSLAANMDYYNTRVNVALWLGGYWVCMWWRSLSEREQKIRGERSVSGVSILLDGRSNEETRPRLRRERGTRNTLSFLAQCRDCLAVASSRPYAFLERKKAGPPVHDVSFVREVGLPWCSLTHI
jgi:hypothetical protein